MLDSVSLFSDTEAFPLVLTGWLTVPKSTPAYSVSVVPPPGSKTGTSEKNSLYQYIMARPDELVMLWAVSKLKNHVAYGWTSKGDLWQIMSPVADLYWMQTQIRNTRWNDGRLRLVNGGNC